MSLIAICNLAINSQATCCASTHFRENQLAPGSRGISTLNTIHLMMGGIYQSTAYGQVDQGKQGSTPSIRLVPLDTRLVPSDTVTFSIIFSFFQDLSNLGMYRHTPTHNMPV